MLSTSSRTTWPKRLLLLVGGLVVFVLLFVVAVRITVSELFRGIASSKATGLSAIESWDTRSMWSSGGAYLEKGVAGDANSWIARSADIRTRSSTFDRSVAALHRIVTAHRGYLEDLRT